MPSAYLQPSDYAAYGVTGATAAQVQAASLVIDGFLKRKEGCVWVPDANGNPAYMAGATPIYSLTATGAISPGTSVVVPYTGMTLNTEMIGDVLVLDKANGSVVEACVITAIAPGRVTLASVSFSHFASATMDAGLVIYEQRDTPASRSIVSTSKYPVLRLLSGYGQYGYGRRSNQVRGDYAEFNLLATISSFGGPPQWIGFDVTQCDIVNDGNDIWIPAGILLAYFSSVRLRYVAGWSQANLPPQIKQACANLISATGDIPVSPNIKSFNDQSVGISMTRFSATRLDTDTQAMLVPYQARLFI